MDKHDDIADQQHLARLATAFATKLTSPSPTATIPLKGVDPPEPPDSNLLSITAISLEGKALFRYSELEVAEKEKSSVINRIEIHEIQVTDLHQNFICIFCI